MGTTVRLALIALLLLSFASTLFAGFSVVQAQTPQGEELYESHSAVEVNSVP